MSYQPRSYRNHTKTDGLVSFTVVSGYADLFISASQELKKEAKDAVLSVLSIIEGFIRTHPCFLSALVPVEIQGDCDDTIQKMLQASRLAGVGPMACVAGAVAQYTGLKLLDHCAEVIVENGGDLFIKNKREMTVAVFAGQSPLSGKLGIKIKPSDQAVSVCTSSGTVGHSLSFGKADAAVIKSKDAFIADAAATAVANRVKDETDIASAIETAKKISAVDGVVIIKGDSIGVWGDIEITAL